MTALRALLAAGSMLAFLGGVVLAPVGWALFLYIVQSPSVKPIKDPGRGGAYTVKLSKSR